MKNEHIEEAARALIEQQRERRVFARVDSAPLTIEDGYRVQDAILEQIDRPLAGWKIALTTPVMQKFVGMDHPVAGAILADGAQETPASVCASDCVRLGVETEIAVRMAEIVDDRNFDYENPDGPMFVADGAFNRGCVTGPGIVDWRAVDLATTVGRMRINEEEVGTGVGGDVLGHPFEALAWLANHLLSRGRKLRAGEVVLTGSIVATQFLKAGDQMVSEVAGLGAATLRVQ